MRQSIHQLRRNVLCFDGVIVLLALLSVSADSPISTLRVINQLEKWWNGMEKERKSDFVSLLQLLCAPLLWIQFIFFAAAAAVVEIDRRKTFFYTQIHFVMISMVSNLDIGARQNLIKKTENTQHRLVFFCGENRYQTHSPTPHTCHCCLFLSYLFFLPCFIADNNQRTNSRCFVGVFFGVIR